MSSIPVVKFDFRKKIQVINKKILFSYLLLCIPSGFLIYNKSPELATVFYLVFVYIFLFLFFSQLLLNNIKRHEFLAIILGSIPLLQILRNEYIFYNSVIFVELLVLLSVLLSDLSTVVQICKKKKIIIFLFIFSIFYYLVGVLTTKIYTTNIRFIEFSLMILLIVILGILNEKNLRIILQGFLILTFFIFLSLTNYVDFSVAAESRIGSNFSNPMTLGTGLATVFIFLLFDNGYWFNLQTKNILRFSLLVVFLALTLLTTSRVSWFIVIFALLFSILRNNKKSNLIVFIIMLIFSVFLISNQNNFRVSYWLDKTFNFSQRSLTSISNGRSDQWLLAYNLLLDDKSKIFSGYGIGNIDSTPYSHYALQVSIKNNLNLHPILVKSEWHSLILKLLIEGGIIFFLPFLFCFVYLMIYLSTKKSIVRSSILSALYSYFFIILTVVGWDPISGFLMGISWYEYAIVSEQKV